MLFRAARSGARGYFTSSAGLQVSTVIERRPVIYHNEPWELEYEEWREKSRKAQVGEFLPGAR